jgi:hypothetical protein
MSMFVSSPSAAAIEDITGSFPCKMAPQEVVEIGLLLPTDWAVALVKLSEKRQQTVAQILRSLIERALFQGDASP